MAQVEGVEGAAFDIAGHRLWQALVQIGDPTAGLGLLAPCIPVSRVSSEWRPDNNNVSPHQPTSPDRDVTTIGDGAKPRRTHTPSARRGYT